MFLNINILNAYNNILQAYVIYCYMSWLFFYFCFYKCCIQVSFVVTVVDQLLYFSVFYLHFYFGATKGIVLGLIVFLLFITDINKMCNRTHLHIVFFKVIYFLVIYNNLLNYQIKQLRSMGLREKFLIDVYRSIIIKIARIAEKKQKQ